MSDLKTLRSLSGLPPEPAALSGSALVLIDLQNTYREGVMRLEGVEPAIREARTLLERAREAGIPVSTSATMPGPARPTTSPPPSARSATRSPRGRARR